MRAEERRLLAGKGSFVGDLKFSGMVNAAFLRSPHAHAHMRAIDVSQAAAAPGVLAVFTGQDIEQTAAGLQSTIPLPALPTDEVCFVGQAVAMVVAADRYRAEDALDLIDVHFEPLPVVSDPERALQPGAPRVDTTRESNLAARLTSSRGDIATAFADADVTLRRRFQFPPASGHPLECRGLVAMPDPATGGLVCWSAAQRPHMVRDAIADGLELSNRQVRVITPDVGGSFGIKSGVYPEDLCVPWAASRLGRPVKWIEDRLEHFSSVAHERAQIYDVELAARADGKVLGLRARIVHDQGSHVLRSAVVPENSIHYLPGPYAIPAYEAECLVAFSNKISSGPYRGAGWPTANYVLERLLDFLADELGVDRVAIRRLNLLNPDELPFHTGITLKDGHEIVYDSGDFPAILAAVGALADDGGFEDRRRRSLGRGRLLGRGVSYGMKGTGTHFETATMTVDHEGCFWLYIGVPSQGQNHERTFAELCARAIDVDPALIHVVATDTATLPEGWGTNASRSAPVGAVAAAATARQLAAKIVQTSALLFQAEESEVAFKGGVILLPTGQSVTLKELAQALRDRLNRERSTASESMGLVPELSATATFFPEGKTFTSAAYYIEAEVDAESGAVLPMEMSIAYDCGNVIDEAIVEGQMLGGVSYGISMALLEELVYAEDGQLVTSSYVDYFLPDAGSMPRMRTTRLEYPSLRNPDGFKGVGEIGAIGPAAALAAAVEDAVKDIAAIEICRLPIAPHRLHDLLHGESPG